MAIYLGDKQLKINTISGSCRLLISTIYPIVNGIMLLSYDNYILKDSNGVYLTVKESS